MSGKEEGEEIQMEEWIQALLRVTRWRQCVYYGGTTMTLVTNAKWKIRAIMIDRIYTSKCLFVCSAVIP